MENESLIIRLHHKGDFLKSKYSGGLHETFRLDPDLFSYSVLMEFVKELKYDEIGGIYVTKENNNGWKLLMDDRGVGEYIKGKSVLDFYIDCNVDERIPPMKQMQPHVIVRPRPGPLKVIEKNTEKRTFVTLKNITDERERRISTRKKLQFKNLDVSPTKEGKTSVVAMEEEETKLLSFGEYIKRFEESDHESRETEKDGEDLVKEFCEGQGCNDYEMGRNKRVAENKAKVAELGLIRMTVNLTQNVKGKEKVTNNDNGQSESDYVPNNDVERQSDDDDDIVNSKVHFKLYLSIKSGLDCLLLT